MANEISLLRKSLQTLNARLREISDKIYAPDSKGGASTDPQNRISLSLDLLARAPSSVLKSCESSFLN